MRLATSIAKVNHGRPMGSRCTEFDHEHVDLGMIDFHDFERMARTVFAHDRREARAGGLRSFPVLQEQALILARDPGLYRIPGRRTRATDPAQLAHMPSQRVDARLLARAIEFLDRVVDELVLVGRKPARSLLRPTSPGDKRAGDRRSAKLLDQFIKPRPSDAQLPTGLVDCSRLDQVLRDQRTYHGGALRRLAPALFIDLEFVELFSRAAPARSANQG